MYRNIIVVLLAILFSSTVVAKEDTFNMEARDITLSQAAKLVNGFCAKEHGKVAVSHPNEKLSLKLESATCSQAIKLLHDYDHGAA